MAAGKADDRKGLKRRTVDTEVSRDSRKIHRSDGAIVVETANWGSMSTDLLTIIFANLDGWSVMKCLLVSKGWNRTASRVDLWGKIVDREFGINQICAHHLTEFKVSGGGREYGRMWHYLRPYWGCSGCKEREPEKSGSYDKDIPMTTKILRWRGIDSMSPTIRLLHRV